MHAARLHAMVGGRRAAYVEAGPETGRALVLLHGAGFDHADLSWRRTIEDLGRDRRVVAPDIPGHGSSESLDAPPDLPRLSAWLVAFLDALGIARADVAGVSMGGGMALWLALEHPHRVDRLIPVCPYGIMARAPMHALAAMLARTGLGPLYALAGRSRALTTLGLAASYARSANITARTVDEVMAVARDQRRRRSFDTFLAAEIGRHGLRSDFTPRLPAIGAPTLFVAGRSDRLVPPRHVRRAAALVSAAQLLEVPTGHWPMRERPDLLNPALRAFLDR